MRKHQYIKGLRLLCCYICSSIAVVVREGQVHIAAACQAHSFVKSFIVRIYTYTLPYELLPYQNIYYKGESLCVIPIQS
jgi:hypothetical protein